MNEEKIKEVFSNEEFVKSLMELETPEEVQKALMSKDVDFSVGEIKKIGEMLQKRAEGELTDEDLENVAGGSATVLACFAVASVAMLGTSIHVVTRRRW